jgi:hypothetical protein
MAYDVLKERGDLDFPVTKEWVDRVKAALDRMGHGSRARLAEHCKVNSRAIAELFSDNDTSNLVAAVHKFLGWPPPVSPLRCVDLGIVFEVSTMDPAQLGYLNDAVDVMLGKSGEQARRALIEQLKALRRSEP